MWSIKILPAFLILLFPLLLARQLAAAPAPAADPSSPSTTGDYELSLSFFLGEGSGSLTGTAKIDILPGTPLTLAFPQLTITGTTLQNERGREKVPLPQADILTIPAAPERRTLHISYTKNADHDADNSIGPAGITLTSGWYPIPDQPMRYRLSAILPSNFTAITEADTFPLARKDNTVQTKFSRPTHSIHFIAGPYTIHKRQVRENLFVYSMFFAEDEGLADGYLQAAADYLNRYEREIGPYPFNHYVIVANRRPTGLGMPTFTLLGQTVLRLPFIKSTSLGHEIVHSWFGNAVEVDYVGGNWCEGLTAFLADRAFREESGEGAADRRESITRYMSYVGMDTAIPLRAFASANHDQAQAEAKRAVGYDRGALLFHELREKIGKEAFDAGLRRFYADNTGRTVGWEELERSFAAAAGMDLARFFAERLERRDIPDIAVKDIKITMESHHPVLAFTLLQQTDTPYSLIVPVRIRTLAGDKMVKLTAEQTSTQIAIPLEQRPLEFTLDPDHAFLRQLTAAEYPPIWSRFLGSKNRLAVLGGGGEQDLFKPLIDTLGEGLTVTDGSQVTDKELAEHDLLFLSADQPRARALFGPPPEAKGFTLDVRSNPLNPGRVAVLVTGGGSKDIEAVAQRLGHYGKYSSLTFEGGRNTAKEIRPVENGLRFVLEDLPRGGAARDLDSFAGMVEKLAEAQVVYIGETHTSRADHQLQLRLIEALYLQNPSLAIGMEMFPAYAQPVLDRYTQGKEPFDERSFLRETDYFNVWRYDWRYYRDIMNFAKMKNLPVVGLNLDRQIVSEVFRTGGTDSLSPKVRDSLPPDRDLDMAGYTERLADMHAIHVEGKHANGGSGGFVQAQALWDETMAENTTRFLQANPGYRMVVLAGNQHTRKDSGIPPRVARRLPVKQATVTNAAGDRSSLDLDLLTDYYFFALAEDLPETPKIGVVLLTETQDGRSSLKINQISPQGKAAAAGLKEGDIITEIGGLAVTDMADLHIAMLDVKAGDVIGVTARRLENGEEKVLDFQVELTVPPPTRPHP